jgi:hypothetical protein
MTPPSDDLRRLVRRDLMVAAGGAFLAIASLAVLVASKLGAISTVNAGRVAVASTAVVTFGCIYWWASGPRMYLRDRLIVLTPVFLIAGPGLIGIYYLGGGVAVAILSGAFGFAAAAAGGLAWTARKAE